MRAFRHDPAPGTNAALLLLKYNKEKCEKAGREHGSCLFLPSCGTGENEDGAIAGAANTALLTGGACGAVFRPAGEEKMRARLPKHSAGPHGRRGRHPGVEPSRKVRDPRRGPRL